MDHFSSIWQAICRIVNLAMSPFGPKDNTLKILIFDKCIIIR